MKYSCFPERRNKIKVEPQKDSWQITKDEGVSQEGRETLCGIWSMKE